MLKEITLPRASEAAAIEILGLQNLDQVLRLQDATRAALPDAQKMFVLPQTPAYFERLLKRENGQIIGVMVKDQLVAQMVVMGVMTLDEVTQQQKLTRNEVLFHHAEPSDLIVMMKSMAVHPDWRGNDLSQTMLESALELPFVRAADHVFAQMSADNVRSWELFLRHGFGIIAAAVDPGDLKARFIVQKPALGFSLHHTQSVDDVDPAADFAAIMRLTQREALIGKLDDGVGFKLAFYAGIDSAAAWTDEVAGLKGSA
jgi:N-acetylglutamate synthase-like GNAT family acetyltransferase